VKWIDNYTKKNLIGWRKRKGIKNIFYELQGYRDVKKLNGNLDFLFNFYCLKCKKIFLKKNIFIEQSLSHIDNIIFNNDLNNCFDSCSLKNNNIFIFQNLNNNFIPVLIKNFYEIYYLKTNLNYYIINEYLDLKRLNFLKNYIFDRDNYIKYNENFYLVKIESNYKKNKKNFWVFSLYGYNIELQKFKFLFFFEIFYIKSNFLRFKKLNFYKDLDYFFSFIYIRSTYNRYYWLNLTGLLDDDDDNIYKNNEWKDPQTYFYENWLRGDINKFSNLLIAKREKDYIQYEYDYIQTEKKIKISEWVLKKEFEYSRALLVLEDTILKENLFILNPLLKKKNIIKEDYDYYSDLIFKLKDWEVWIGKKSFIDKKFIKYIKFNIKFFFFKFEDDGHLKD